MRFRAGDQNLFRYVLSNPVNFTDPNGELAFVLALPFIAGGGGVALSASAQLAIASTVALAAGSAIFNAAKNALQSSSSNRPPGTTPNTQDPEGAEETFQEAQDKAKDPRNRPSVKDPRKDGGVNEWEGAKKKPKQSEIEGFDKTKQGAKTKRKSRFQCL